MGSLIARKLHLTARERRILLLAGAAGGLGAIFRAPLGGALTAVEVIYSEDFEAEALLPAIVSSVVAYTLFTFFFGRHAIIQTPDYHFGNVLELPFYLGLSLVVSLAAHFYIRTFFFFKFKIFAVLREKWGITPTMVVGGVAMGLFGMVFHPAVGGGYGWIEQAVNGHLGILFLLALFFGKTLATSFTIGSGLSGGMATGRALLRGRAVDQPGPASLLTEVNTLLCQDTQLTGRFITLFFLRLDHTAREIVWTRAGHDPGLLYDPASGDFSELKGPGIPLGVTPEWEYVENRHPWLSSGQVLVLYTDGIHEARNAADTMYGRERIMEVVRANAGAPASAIINALVAALRDFKGGLPLEDDVTLVVIKATA